MFKKQHIALIAKTILLAGTTTITVSSASSAFATGKLQPVNRCEPALTTSIEATRLDRQNLVRQITELKLALENKVPNDLSKLKAQLALSELALLEVDEYFVEFTRFEKAKTACKALVKRETTLTSALPYIPTQNERSALQERINIATVAAHKSCVAVHTLADKLGSLAKCPDPIGAPQAVQPNNLNSKSPVQVVKPQKSLASIALAMVGSADRGADSDGKPQSPKTASLYENTKWEPNSSWSEATKASELTYGKIDYGKARNTLSAVQYSLPGSLLDKRGLTSAITASKSGTSLSLGIADEIRFRGIPATRTNDFYQQFSTVGYALKLSTGSKGKIFTSTDTEEKDPAERSIDRIASDTAISGTLSWNIYGRETAKIFAKKEKAMRDKALKACRDEQKEVSKYPSSCLGNDLHSWIFSQDLSTGSYAHPEMVQAWNAAYWGPPTQRPNALYGMGLRSEIGWKDFEFTPTGATESVTEDKFNYSLSPFFYYAPSAQSVLIYQLTYKDDWELDEDTKLPVKEDSFIPSLEYRYLFSGTRLNRYLFPRFGLAPKLSFDETDDRWSAELPLYLVSEDDKLTGGFKLARNWGGEDKNEWGVGIFVGTTFSLNGRE